MPKTTDDIRRALLLIERQQEELTLLRAFRDRVWKLVAFDQDTDPGDEFLFQRITHGNLQEVENLQSILAGFTGH